MNRVCIGFLGIDGEGAGWVSLDWYLLVQGRGR